MAHHLERLGDDLGPMPSPPITPILTLTVSPCRRGNSGREMTTAHPEADGRERTSGADVRYVMMITDVKGRSSGQCSPWPEVTSTASPADGSRPCPPISTRRTSAPARRRGRAATGCPADGHRRFDAQHQSETFMAQTHHLSKAAPTGSAEHDDLTTRGRAEIARKIEAARELGDLSENDHYAAKEEQGKMEGRIRQLATCSRTPRSWPPTDPATRCRTARSSPSATRATTRSSAT